MRDLGYVQGKNLSIEWRSAVGNNDRLFFLASELVSLKVDVIVVAGSPATSAALMLSADVVGSPLSIPSNSAAATIISWRYSIFPKRLVGIIVIWMTS